MKGIKGDKQLEDIFILVEASKLSLTDEFMQHIPKTKGECLFKTQLSEVIKSGIKDFYRPKYDPAFGKMGEKIRFVSGAKPAIGKSYNWWSRTAKEFSPERKSRLGTKEEYFAFLGVLIKSLVSEGWSAEGAWNAVCNDSRDLGHYWNSKGAYYKYEPTGSRNVCSWYDLGNTCKIFAKEKCADFFWVAGGGYTNFSDCIPLSSVYHLTNLYSANYVSVGWIVCEN